MRESGEMSFRTMLPLGSGCWGHRACVDGQMGSILRFYREWKLSGDDAWLKRYWEKIKNSLEYAWSLDNHDYWDSGKTGVMAAAAAQGKWSGVHFGGAEPLKPWIQRGMQLNLWNSDSGLLSLGAKAMAELRGVK